MPQPEHMGRIRVNEDEARVLYRMLVSERLRILLDRRRARDDGEDIHFYQRQLHHIKNLRLETELLAEQKGWDIGQPLSPYEEGTDPAVPARSQVAVGEWDRTDYGDGRRLRGSTSSP